CTKLYSMAWMEIYISKKCVFHHFELKFLPWTFVITTYNEFTIDKMNGERGGEQQLLAIIFLNYRSAWIGLYVFWVFVWKFTALFETCLSGILKIKEHIEIDRD
ncbi:hypothetical protein ACJX0J_020168, partial [Zea mays]